MWEILVPCRLPTGRLIAPKTHRIWDDFVRKQCDGLTLLKTAKGQWIHPVSKKVIDEKMIPVRIVCNEMTLKLIADFTREFYSQHTVLAYSVSETVRFFS